MNVAILGVKSLSLFGIPSGGSGRSLSNILNHSNPNIKYFVYQIKGKEPDFIDIPSNVTIISISSFNKPLLNTFFFFLFSAIHASFMRNFDVIHINHSSYGIFLPLMKLSNSSKIIGTIRGAPYEQEKYNKWLKIFFKFSEYSFIKFCDIVTSVSKINDNLSKKIQIIPNGIENYYSNFYKSNILLSDYNLIENGYIMFSCARLYASKGLHYLIDAYLKLQPNLKLIAIGDPSHDRHYAEFITKKIKGHNQILFIQNPLPLEDLLFLIKNSKLFVFPSEKEGMSLMLLEVIGCKKLLLCSDIYENTAVVGENYKYLFRSKDSNSLTIKLDQALREKSPQLVAANLFNFCSKKFSWQNVASSYEFLYRNLLQIN